MSFHSRVSPSSADRYFPCPGSVRKTAGAKRTSNQYAAEGTVLHEIAAWCLEFGFEPGDFVGCTFTADGFTFKIGYGEGETDPDCMLDGLDWLRDQPGQVFIEKRVKLDPWQPGQSGSLDIGFYDSIEEMVTIVDWKFGVGIPVTPVQNKQGRLYAIGCVEDILKPLGIIPKRVKIVILQPRCPGGGGEWEITYDELMAFAQEAAEAFQRTEDPNAPLHAGEKQCFYCPANPKNGGAGCEELDRFVLDLMGSKFDEMDENIELGTPPILPKYQSLTPERRVFIWQHTKMVTTWLEMIHTGLLADAEAGNPAPGVKAVDGRMGDRKYADEEAAEAIIAPVLGDDTFTKKLISPAQAEKVMKPKRGKPGHPEAWAQLQKIIRQDQGKPALTTADDDRPARKSVDEKFDEEAPEPEA